MIDGWQGLDGTLAPVSFDLYFVPGGTPWPEAMDAIEQAAMSDDTPDFTAEQLEQWDRIHAAATAAIPDLEDAASDRHRELDHMATGMQLSMYPGEIALTVPYWHTDEEAAAVTDLLRTLVEIVERETGLVAYDPQADGPFLGVGDASAAETMTDVRHRMETVLGEQPGVAQTQRPWWKRLFGR